MRVSLGGGDYMGKQTDGIEHLNRDNTLKDAQGVFL